MMMFKKYKLKIIISSIMTLLPLLFGIVMWKHLPETMTTHWNAHGTADGFSSKAFVVFGFPWFFLLIHFVCLLFTLLDKKQTEQNPKALEMVFWIAPIISLFANGLVYRAAFREDFDVSSFVPALLGILFILIGNYLPKIKQNYTLGIKIPWTLQSEENWNKTHRLGGKLWVISGIAILFCVFLPTEAMVYVMICALAIAAIVPVIYSYYISKKH